MPKRFEITPEVEAAFARGAEPTSDVASEVAVARKAQAIWTATPVDARLEILRKLRHGLAENADSLAALVEAARKRPRAETLVAEVLPLADACRFLEQEAPRILAPRRLGGQGRPFWLRRVSLEVFREPFGVVLIIAPSNYLVFLPFVQSLQALVAGNAVLLKPGNGGLAVARKFASLLEQAGLDPRLFRVLDESPKAAQAAIEAGVGKVVLTGSAETGKAVLAELAPRLTPATMELSGHDAVFVLESANLELVIKALRFGTQLNAGQTCIAPRRVFVAQKLAATLQPRLAAEKFGPLLELTSFDSEEEALAAAAKSPLALGASVFGEETAARRLAARISAGTVVINDMIVPTADPRLPFGGRGDSGFGVTRGAEGLLEMTTVKAVATRRGKWLPHLEEPHPHDAELFRAYIKAAHGRSLADRCRALVEMIRAAMKR